MLVVIVQLGDAKRSRLPYVRVAVAQEVSNLRNRCVNKLLDMNIGEGPQRKGPDKGVRICYVLREGLGVARIAKTTG